LVNRDSTRQLTILIELSSMPGSPFWVVKPSSNYTSIFVVARSLKSNIRTTMLVVFFFLFPLHLTTFNSWGPSQLHSSI